MSKVLLYNITGGKLTQIRLAALRLGLELVEVPEEGFSYPIGYVLGCEGFAPSETAERFSDEMLVMETLCSPLLDDMRRSGAAVALKAVVTEQNRGWSGARLCRELRREHEAMRAYASKRPAHVHKKKK